MANYIELADIENKTYVTQTSRYIDSKIYYYTEARRITFETWKRVDIPPSDDDQFMVITKGVEYRPDLVSQQAYGMPDYWWRILQANKMTDIMEFKAGENIRIPNRLF